MEQVELSYSNLMSYTLCYAWYMLGRVLRMRLSLLQLHKSVAAIGIITHEH